ncbi:TIGR01620 family protein [Telmatospirillum sp. J64-1]|uniref:TIGR01620 family protein n=1 Tax=Telmatospirillum sp. J64-1 TaxID=2502183 RepID=UPI00115C877A|nr:TIGR01620 family protein [Telmatospirillum sp. J64-1]
MTDKRPPHEPGPVDPSLVTRPAPEETAPPGAEPGIVSSPVEALDEEPPPEPLTRRPSPWGRVLALLVLTIGAFLIYDTTMWLSGLFTRDPVGAGLLGLLFAALLVSLAFASWREVRALRRLGEVDKFRRALAEAEESNSPRRLEQALTPVLTMVGERRPELVRNFRHRSQGLNDTAAILRQFHGAVLTPLDAEARRVVRLTGYGVMGATAVSPHPALDVAIVVWRSLAMIRRIGEIYGFRPSSLSTLVLARSVITSAALAAAADPAGQAMADALGGSLLEKLSARFAEGGISGLRALRVGLRAIDLCRPIPFEAEERKGMLRTLVEM